MPLHRWHFVVTMVNGINTDVHNCFKSSYNTTVNHKVKLFEVARRMSELRKAFLFRLWRRRMHDRQLHEHQGQGHSWSSQHVEPTYVSCPPQYDTVRVVKSVVRSDHQAVMACTASQPVRVNKQKLMGTHRKITPTQHAIFLQYISNHEDLFKNHTDTLNTQSEFDLLSVALGSAIIFTSQPYPVVLSDCNFITRLLYKNSY